MSKNNNEYMPKHASKEDREKYFHNKYRDDDSLGENVDFGVNKVKKDTIKDIDNNVNNGNDLEETVILDINEKDNNSDYVKEDTGEINSDFWTGNIPVKKYVNKKEKNNKVKKKHKFIYSVLILFFLGSIGFSSYKIILWLIDNNKTSKSTDKVNEMVDVNEVEDDEDTLLISSVDDKDNPYWFYVKFPLIDVDINKLKSENGDIVGWINVNNTNVNYPFVQTKDNEYYLNHSIDKSFNEAGWLFLDYRNSSDLNDRNNIIYAHSRLDKSMFGSLSKVLKSSWYDNKDNHIIRVSIESENTLWQIFSVYKIKTENYYITTYFDSDDEYLEFLNTISSRSLYDFNTKLNKDDKILTLSTCYSDTERTVVHAKLIKKDME